MTEIDSVVGNFKEGFLLEMKKGMTGSKYWKKHWVYADSDIFFQWQSSAKPINGESPKYSCTLKECRIEESQIRQFAFKITANGSSDSMIYAADDFDTYESWLKILFGDAAYSELEKSEEKSEIASTAYSEEFQQFTSDKIADFFYEHDVSTEPRCPMINEKDLRKLLHSFDPALNTTNTIGVIFHDLHIKYNAPSSGISVAPTKGGVTISYEEFKQWWSTHSHLFVTNEKSTANDEISHDSVNVFQNVEGVDSILFVGLQSVPLSTNTKGDFLYKARVPKFSIYEQFVAPSAQPVSDDVGEAQQPVDWNEVYQSARENASISQSYHLQAEDESALTELWTNYRVSPPVEEESQSPARRDRTESAESAESTHKVGPLHTPDEAVRACLTLATRLGEFYQTAVEGAKLLVDEYSLPLGMKSTPRVTATLGGDVDKPSDESAVSIGEDLFQYRGLLLRVVESPTTDADRQPDPARQKEVVTNDEMAYKRAAAELRTSNACLGAMESLYTDYQTAESWKRPQASASDIGSGSPKKASKFKHLLRPCVLLNTLVNYGGFCVQVFSPAHIAEQFTLVHGFSSVPIHPAAPAEGESDTGDAETLPEDLGSMEVFVNSLPAYRSVLSQLAGALNVKLSRRLLNVTTASIFDSEDSFAAVHAELLSTQLQAHKSADDRLYMLNFGGVFPSDLPREFSFDAVHRQLRPEFARNYRSQPVPCGPVFASLSHEILAGDGEDASEDDADRRSAQESALSACNYLYTALIPGVARTLDALGDLVPCDSHELAQYLHSRGLNVRHIGLLHTLCRTPCVRLLLLTECVARACKYLLRHSLRRIARQCRSESLAAEKRGRSKTGDFIELMDLAHARRKQAVLDLFNAVFAFPLSGNSDLLGQGGGSRGSSEDFWRGALLQTISQKFGVDLEQVLMGPAGSSKRLSTLLHLPQLFLALQYHTNCRFKDNAFLHVFSGAGSSLFVIGDILDCCLSSCDGQQTQTLQHIPGELGRIASSAEEFLSSGLYSEATQAFQLRLTLLATLNTTRYDEGQAPHTVLTLRQEAVFADAIYKLALSQYCNKQYNEASATVRHHYLARHTQYSAQSGRMLTLLMCIEQRCGRADRVRAYFDAAQCVYTYALSVHHPIIAMHMCALADLYQRDGGLKQARAMLVLARSVGGKALGEHHQVNAALACKLAVLHMNGGQYKEAAQLLSNALSIFDATAAAIESSNNGDGSDGSATRKLEEQIIDCLCALTESLARCEELDLAIHSGFRCVETCTKMLSSPTRTLVERKCNESRLSCLLILSDLFVQKSELDSAFGLLHEAWTALQSSTATATARRGSGRALAALACRILELMISTLPMQTRSHFESVSDEALLSVDFTSSVWDRANAVVCGAMWSQKPADYLAAVIHGIQRQELDEKKVNRKEDHVSFSLQAAVISRFIKNPQEFSQQLISF